MPGLPTVTAASIMDSAAALLNDTAKTIFTYSAQIPYLNIALKELQEHYELNNVPTTDSQSSSIKILSGSSVVPESAVPSDLVEIQNIWESQTGLNQWGLMRRVNSLPPYDGTPNGYFGIWSFSGDAINLPICNNDRDVKIDYIRSLFTEISASTDRIRTINASSFLFNRTAALIAFFIGENESRAQELDAPAQMALDRALGISTKGRQAIITRRRPFRRGNRGSY